MIDVYPFHIFLFYQNFYIFNAEHKLYKLIKSGYNQASLFEYCLKHIDIVSGV